MNSQAAYKALPSVDKCLQTPELKQLVDELGHDLVKLKIKATLESLRSAIAENDSELIVKVGGPNFFTELCQQIVGDLSRESASTLVSVFNLTGTVVHTNLGRARLPAEAVKAMSFAAAEATNLEFDLGSGKRGDRDSHLENALCEITGAEAATVVNNNAAAVVLVLNSLALDKEVLISRGELVEIGGAFRIPDVMKSASCILKEVGTTNRTHLKDFSDGVNESTGLFMKVHTSNYEIRGFTKSVGEAELAELAATHSVPFVSDLGSGTLVDLRQYGLPYEPTVKDTLDSGTDVVTFSGDKLLGGPQAGIIVGKKSLIDKIKRNPLKRALRVDKVTLAGLVEVINLYKDPRRLSQRLPILKDLSRPVAEINELADRLLPEIAKALAGKAEVCIQLCKSQIGSGALPLDLLESKAIVIKALVENGGKDKALTTLSEEFRQLPKPVVGRLHDGNLIFDLRCLYDEAEFIDQLKFLGKT